MNYLLTVTADPNDADYETENTKLNEEQYQEARPLLERVGKALKDAPRKKGYGGTHNWEMVQEKGLLSEDDIDWFSEYMPSSEEQMHSIIKITVTEIAEQVSYF